MTVKTATKPASAAAVVMHLFLGELAAWFEVGKAFDKR